MLGEATRGWPRTKECTPYANFGAPEFTSEFEVFTHPHRTFAYAERLR
jgi:hypothetical protein